MRKTIILALMLCPSLFSCEDVTAENSMDKETMITNLSKDKDYRELRKAEANYFIVIREGAEASGKVDWNLIKKTKPKSKDEYIKVLKTAGMKNPEKYVNAKLEVMSAMLKIKNKHSEFKHLSKSEISEIFKGANDRFEKDQNRDNIF